MLECFHTKRWLVYLIYMYLDLVRFEFLIVGYLKKMWIMFASTKMNLSNKNELLDRSKQIFWLGL